MDCDCLPSCSEEIYEVETTICLRTKTSKLRSIITGLVGSVICNQTIIQNFHIFSQSFDPENTTTVRIHFKDMSCIKYRRELYLTWDGVFGTLLF